MARKPRNPVARSPLLRKGGAHRKTRSGERMQSKKLLREEVEHSTTGQEAHKNRETD